MAVVKSSEYLDLLKVTLDAHTVRLALPWRYDTFITYILNQTYLILTPKSNLPLRYIGRAPILIPSPSYV